MFIMPRADFWRPWIVALALGIAAIAGWSAFEGAHAATLRASFYGAESGRLTASGLPFRPMGFTAASWTMPFGTRFRACLDGCASGVVTDRGPARWTGRDIDLSRGLARAIGLERRGVALIRVTTLRVTLLGRAPHLLRHGRRRRGHHHHH